MSVITICDIEEDTSPTPESEIEAFEKENQLILPDLLRQILLETNGGYLREENLKFDETEKDLLVDVEEIFGIYEDDLDWASAIVPLTRWISHKNDIYESYPTVADLEKLNGSLSRYFVFSAIGSKFHLLDYTDTEHCKRIASLDLVAGDQVISTLGDDFSCVLSSEILRATPGSPHTL